MYLLVKLCDMRILQCFMCAEKQFSCFMGNELIANIIFIFKIEIKSTLGYTCLIYDI